MVENPQTWGPLEKAIDEAMREADDARAAGRIGLSRVRQIADKLREQGLVNEPRHESSPALHPDGYPVDEMGG